MVHYNLKKLPYLCQIQQHEWLLIKQLYSYSLCYLNITSTSFQIRKWKA